MRQGRTYTHAIDVTGGTCAIANKRGKIYGFRLVRGSEIRPSRGEGGSGGALRPLGVNPNPKNCASPEVLLIARTMGGVVDKYPLLPPECILGRE